VARDARWDIPHRQLALLCASRARQFWNSCPSFISEHILSIGGSLQANALPLKVESKL
jgi:hypothetical protein